MKVGGPGIVTPKNTGGVTFIPGPGGVSIPGEARSQSDLNCVKLNR